MRADIDSPFSPGQIVDPDLFVGRSDELSRLNEALRSTSRGKTQVAFLTGPRGIGKSSLALKTKQLAVESHGLIGIQVFLSGIKTVEDLVKVLFSKLLNESRRFPWFEKAKGLFGEGVRGIDVFGLKFEFQPTPSELSALTRNFGQVISNFVEKLKGDIKGVVLILDDINGLADQPEFADWIKATVDEMRTLEPNPHAFVILSGLSGRRDALLKNQPSLDRIINVVSVDAWTQHEAEHFFFTTFQSAGVEITVDAASFLARFSGGFPVMAHELGDAAFYKWRNSEWDKIDKPLVLRSIESAAREIGRKYMDSQFLGAIRSERYMSVLNAITEEPDLIFSRRSVCERLPKTEAATFDNFVQKMRTLGFFEKYGDRGGYRWVNPMHWAYVALFQQSREQPNFTSDIENMQRGKELETE